MLQRERVLQGVRRSAKTGPTYSRFTPGRENEKIMLAGKLLSAWCVEIKEETIYFIRICFQGYAEKSYFLHIPGMKSGKIRKESNSMKLFAFNELFSKEKKSRGQESLVCFGKINNGEVFISPVVCLDAKPLNAVIYNRFVSSESAQCFLDYEREIEVLYCEVQEYNLLAMFNSVGCSTAVEDIAWDKILELARKHLIDVVVLQSMSRLSGNFEEIIEILDTLYSYGVKVDCMGYGILEQDVLYQYIEKRKRESQILEERILEIMLESMDEGMEG